MSDGWISITVENLEDAKVAALVTALREAALGDDQSDPTDRIIQGVVDDVRRRIASCASNQLDEDETTIPKSLRDLTVDLVIYRMKARLPGQELTEDEVRQKAEHIRTLERIAEGREVVDQPDTAIAPPVQATAGTPSISTCRAEERRQRRSGL